LQTKKLKSLKILVAEDDRVNQTLIKAIFKKIGCEYIVVDTGKKVLEKLQHDSYDVILMDIEMPDMDGYEATVKIRRELPLPLSQIPIISTTAHINESHLKKCFEVGMNGYVLKPVKLKDLVAEIKDVIPEIHDDTIFEDDEASPGNENKTLFNFNSLVIACGGSASIAKNILKLFISQTSGNMKDLKTFLEKQEWESFKNLCHKMKSSYALLGFQQVKKILEDMENECSQNIFNVTKFESNLSLVEMINSNIVIALEETLKNEK
jgi:CheY-like chemotaxis protein/HPt (histidine-containing phosphotransfer) domain-containing protein